MREGMCLELQTFSPPSVFYVIVCFLMENFSESRPTSSRVLPCCSLSLTSRPLLRCPAHPVVFEGAARVGTGMAASCKGSRWEGFRTVLHCSAGNELTFAQEGPQERAWLAGVTWPPGRVREAGHQGTRLCSQVFLCILGSTQDWMKSQSCLHG